MLLARCRDSCVSSQGARLAYESPSPREEWSRSHLNRRALALPNFTHSLPKKIGLILSAMPSSRFLALSRTWTSTRSSCHFVCENSPKATPFVSFPPPRPSNHAQALRGALQERRARIRSRPANRVPNVHVRAAPSQHPHTAAPPP